MTSREEAVFTDALAQPDAQRWVFVEQACRGDADLRARVHALLEAHATANNLIDVGAPRFEAFPDEAPGERIGRYKLLQKIGEGGCGVVWMAEQEEPVRRRVALKVIKLGMDTREVIARFSAERQALALMDHPNIAKVLDGGATESGRPYFVMELVRGIPITKFCDDQNLNIRSRLKLFARVCDAVQHAHQKGIIHRDLKPSNILVALQASEPVPVVIDFGIAKAIQGRLTDATVFTSYDQIIGTPAYMSPEQADTGGLDIDTRSDVYSLGVVLYELLTGRCPFDPASLGIPNRDEIRRVIREVEPPRPSTRFSTLPGVDRASVARRRSIDAARLPLLLSGDLDWIVMKALEKNRARRYDTPTSLADDIGRHLRNEPVEARPPGQFYRVRKFVRRNRVAVATATGVALTLIAGSIVSLAEASRATRAERVARAANARAAEERAHADDMLAFMVQDLEKPLKRVGELEVLDRALMKALQHFNSRDPRDVDDHMLVNHVRLLNQLGGLRMDQARYADAEPVYREAQEKAAAVVKHNPRNAAAWEALGDAQWGNGFVRYQRGERPEAREWFQRERNSRAALVALEPTNPQRQFDLAKQQGNFAALIMADEPEVARESFRTQLGILTKLLAQKPDELEFQRSIANTTSFLGTLAEAAGDFTEAAERFAQQTQQLEAIAKTDPKDKHWQFKQADSVLFQAGICLIRGRREEAAHLAARAHELMQPLVQQDPKHQRWRKTLLVIELKQAELLHASGDNGAAARLITTVREQLEAIFAKEPTDVWTQYRLCAALRAEAEARQALGQITDAKAIAARASALADQLVRRPGATLLHRAERAAVAVTVGNIATTRGERTAAQREWHAAAELLSSDTRGTRDWRVLDPAARLAALLGRAKEAQALIRQLNQFGYVPLESWPDIAAPISASNINQ